MCANFYKKKKQTKNPGGINFSLQSLQLPKVLKSAAVLFFFLKYYYINIKGDDSLHSCWKHRKKLNEL